MAPPKEKDSEFIQITDFEEFEEVYQVDKVIKTSSLYTIKLISGKNTPDFCREVLLLEHLPAKKAQAFLWTHKVNSDATQIEVMRKINTALERFFENDSKQLLKNRIKKEMEGRVFCHSISFFCNYGLLFNGIQISDTYSSW